MISKQRLIDSLNEVRKQAILGILYYPEYGICKNWKRLMEDDVSYFLVRHLAQDWEYHNGFTEYPVPDNEDFGLWEGVNLEMRLSLIDHILKCLEEYCQEDIDGLYHNL